MVLIAVFIVITVALSMLLGYNLGKRQDETIVYFEPVEDDEIAKDFKSIEGELDFPPYEKV